MKRKPSATVTNCVALTVSSRKFGMPRLLGTETRMPIRPEMRALYPRNWKEIRAAILARSLNCCENCGVKNHEPHPMTGSKVVLTVAHLDHNPQNNKPENLSALCQLCHNRHDAAKRAAGRKRRRAQSQRMLIGDAE
jgi:5-methylcytosine-specific restriction endonuclease McrA